MQAAVDDDDVVLDAHDRLCAEPREELIAVRRFENRSEAVVLAWRARSGGDAQQVQVVVAEDHARIKVARPTQHP